MVFRLVLLALVLILAGLPGGWGAEAGGKKPAKAKPAAAAKADADQPFDSAPVASKKKEEEGGVAPPPVVPPRKTVRIEAAPGYIDVISDRGGHHTLVINYRWRLHPRASVEVRMIPAERAAGGARVVPVFFVSEQLKGEVEKKVHRSAERGNEVATTESFTKDKMVYKITGERNSLGRTAVSVLPYNEEETPADRPGAVFLQLDDWGLTDDLLYLDMPHEAFAAPGTMFVWFLRGERLIWEAKVPWPGSHGYKPPAK